MTPSRTLEFTSRQGRLVLAATILASGMAFLDSSVINVALPRMQDDLGGGFATMQWVLDGYLLTLGSLVLVGGALGDLLGRKKVFVWGIVGFTVTSVLCGIAPSAGFLVAARTAQGVTAALMVPGSLALLSSLFADEDRGRAIGLWSGLSGVTTAIGPFVGGALVDASASGWRWVFLINVPLAAAALMLCRSVPGLPGERKPGPLAAQVDLLGAFLTVAGLALIVGPLIEFERLGTMPAALLIAAGVGVLVGFWFLEQARERTRAPAPMVPPTLWRFRSFTVANLVTFVVYGALGALLLLFTVGLQIGLGWSALAAGAAGLPITILLALLSAPIGGLLPKVGSRPLLTLGSSLMAVGMVMLSFLPADANYWVNVLPGLLVFALGLAFVVAPITTTALGDIPVASSGTGSGVNNAVARIASLMAVAVVPLMAGLTSEELSGAAVLPGYRTAVLICAGLCAAGAVLSWLGFTRNTGRVADAGRRS
jgi:EmrB/QacA subfamily drug resistance transporter